MSLKAEREKQWGNGGDLPKGWDCYRSTTFMEVIRAKMDRAIQSQERLTQLPVLEGKGPNVEKRLLERKAVLFDGMDSLKDAANYLRKLLELCENDPDFFAKGGMK
jgi:hypothetical protein